MRTYVVLSLGVLALCGCQEEATKSGTVAGTNTATSTPNKTVPAADNSAKNERDRSGVTKTPINQNENEADIKTTAEIRKQVMAQKDFSVSAQNAKIITADGKVTLRGPVKSKQERETIERIARDVAGKDNVDSQLEIAE